MRLPQLSRVFLGVSMLALVPLAAMANTVTMTYFTIAETDKDANHLAGGTFNNEVQTQLGPNGLPVLNTATYGCSSNCYASSGAPTDVTAGGEITYWSPSLNNGGAGGTSDVTQTGTATVSLPFSDGSFFPPNGNGSDDNSGFQAAVLSATLTNTTTEILNFSIGADDMAFAYIDGQVVCDLGGVHGFTTGTCTTATIAAGNHSLQVFFVDINNTQSGFSFDLQTQDVTTSGVPEPGSLALVGLALVGLAAARRAQTPR